MAMMFANSARKPRTLEEMMALAAQQLPPSDPSNLQTPGLTMAGAQPGPAMGGMAPDGAHGGGAFATGRPVGSGLFGRSPSRPSTGLSVLDNDAGPNAGYSPNDLPQASPRQIKPHVFDKGGLADKAGSVLGDIGLNIGAMLGVPSAALAMQRRADDVQEGRWRQRHSLTRGEELADRTDERSYDENKPRYFGGGQDQIKYDPTTGQSRTVYDAPMPAEAYARNFGAAGSDEYKNALQSYTLRGWSDEALDNRTALEGTRYQNRVNLRGQPTYRDQHPRPVAPRAAPQATPNNVLGSILQKAAAGGQLSPPEQDMYNTWKNGRRGGRGPAGGGNSGAPAAPAPVKVRTLDEAKRLPPGTMFVGADGVTRIR